MAGPQPRPDDLSTLHLHDRHTELGLTGEDLLGMYRTILLARVLDQKVWALNRMGKAAFVVSGQGHEGAQVGATWALRAGHDVVLPYYRDTGVLLTLGMTVEQILLAVLARADDPNSGGRQMPNHWGWADGGVITGLLTDRHPAAPRGGLGVRLEAGAGRAGGGVVLRRGRHLQGRLPRGPQLRRDPPTPNGVRLREQRLRHLGPHVRRVGRGRRGRPGPRLRLRRGHRRRQRPARRVRRGPLGRAPRAPGRRVRRSSSARPTATWPTPPTTTTAPTAPRRRWRRGARRTRCAASRSTASSSGSSPRPRRSESRPR